jgi:hypothetical protein
LDQVPTHSTVLSSHRDEPKKYLPVVPGRGSPAA